MLAVVSLFLPHGVAFPSELANDLNSVLVLLLSRMVASW